MLSPNFDYLNLFFNRRWRYPAAHTLGIIIKLADANTGGIGYRSTGKRLTAADHEHLREGVALCREILARLEAPRQKTIFGTINACLPGDMLPLTAAEAESLHSPALPANLYVANASLFPRSLGNPPILTIIALGKRIAKLCKAKF
jgi:hypothetical protein